MSEEQKKPAKPVPVSPADYPEGGGWYRTARFLGGLITKTICPITFHDFERVSEREGGFILIANHQSMMDPVALAVKVKRREITFLGKKELTKNKFLARALTGLHMIVVDRHNSDMRAMRTCISVLRKERILGIFPEGTRHHQGVMTELESGVAMMALMSGKPLVPVYIDSRIRPFHRTHLYAGEPIEYADLRAEGMNNDTAEKLTERIRQTYAAWLERLGK